MIGKTLKHYRIESLLGKGGMGEVFQAVDLKLNRAVALKTIKRELTSDPERLHRFTREARAAAAVNHPAIAQIYDIDVDDGITFIAMELIDGRTVSRLIADGELDLQGAVEIASQVAQGLARAHKAHILHRDIKSDNIMVTRDGHAKLLDFGLAKLLAPEEEADSQTRTAGATLTQTMHPTADGTVMGTIAYMSPEQARGRELKESSDVFSLGVVLYEMVTGKLPFKGESPLDTMHAIAFEEARPVTVLRRNLPPQLHRIVSRCLRKRPEDRYASAQSLAEELKQLKRDIESGIQRPLAPGERLQAWMEGIKNALPFGWMGVAAAAAVLALLAALAFTRFSLSLVFWPTLLGLLLYRYVRNRKSRMLKRFTSKTSGYPAVQAIVIREDQVTVVADRAQAKLYIAVNSLIDTVNQKLFFGKPVSASVRDDLSEEEFQALLREPGVAYVRDDIDRKPGLKHG